MKTNRLRLAFLAVVVVLGLIQLVPVARTNPPASAPVDAPPEVLAVLRTSCFDCHSNETRWPWYSRVAPVSWLVANDVHEARKHLNLSEWGLLPPRQQERLRAEMAEEAATGGMPLRVYVAAHPEARLTDEQKATLSAWGAEVP